MKIIIIYLLLPIFVQAVNGQPVDFSFDNFNVKLSGISVKAFDNNDRLVYSRNFHNPVPDAEDLDGDGVNEFIITDSYTENNQIFFEYYIFNTIDSFYTADSIFSGLFEPYTAISEDLGETVVVAGNPDFDSLNTAANSAFVPVNCWKYDEREVFLVNSEIYDIFINENDNLVDYIEERLSETGKTCSGSKELKAAIAAVYVNYKSAGEGVIAKKFLRKYYICEDLIQFETGINKIINQ